MNVIKRNRKGSVLVEFAVVALIFYLLMAATITFGRAIHASQILQDAARVAARELALIPLPAAMSFEEALEEPSVMTQVFDQDCLVIDLDTDLGGSTLNEFYGTLPPVNQALRSLMIFEEINGRRLLRYPGALFEESVAGSRCTSGLHVAIPLVVGRGSEGVETIDWLPVIEEIDNADANPDPFVVSNGGIVGVRLNYPFQSSMMSGFQAGAEGAFEPNLDNRIRANDAGVVVEDHDGFSPSGTAFYSDGDFGVYEGPYGLGRQLAFAETVRPFRKFLSAQAIFRREVFQ